MTVRSQSRMTYARARCAPRKWLTRTGARPLRHGGRAWSEVTTAAYNPGFNEAGEATCLSRFSHPHSGNDVPELTPPSWFSPTGRFFAAAPSARRGRAVGRGGVQHRHDRLPGDPHRSLVLPADRHAHLSAHRQHRRERRRRRSPRSVYAAGLVIRDLPRAALELARAARTWPTYLRAQRHRRHRRHRHAQADAHPAREGRAERLPAWPGEIDDDAGARGGAGASRAWPAWTWRRSSARDKPYEWTEGSWELGKGYAQASRTRASTWSPTTTASSATSCACWPTRGCRVTVRAGADAGARKCCALKPDGVFLSNGPGDPGALRLRDRGDPRDPRRDRHAGVRHLPRPPAAGPRLGREDAEDEVRPPRRQPPGARTSTPAQVVITSQNHGFAVDPATLPANVRATHVSLFDGSLQGIERTDRPAFCFQGHPEASPGPHDIGYLFDRFAKMMAKREVRRHAQAHRHQEHPDHRRRPDRHRPGLRVRLLGRAGLQGAARGGLPRDPGELQPGDDHDRPGDGRRDLHRAGHLADGRARSSRRSGPTRCCRRWAGRPRSTARSTSRATACWRSSASR